MILGTLQFIDRYSSTDRYSLVRAITPFRVLTNRTLQTTHWHCGKLSLAARCAAGRALAALAFQAGRGNALDELLLGIMLMLAPAIHRWVSGLASETKF